MRQLHDPPGYISLNYLAIIDISNAFRLVGIMSTTEIADIFLHAAYALLIFAAYFQFEMTVPKGIES